MIKKLALIVLVAATAACAGAGTYDASKSHKKGASFGAGLTADRVAGR